jgi:hypothetical protein
MKKHTNLKNIQIKNHLARSIYYYPKYSDNNLDNPLNNKLQQSYVSCKYWILIKRSRSKGPLLLDL